MIRFSKINIMKKAPFMLSCVVYLNSTNNFNYHMVSAPPKVRAPESKRIKGLLKLKVNGAPSIGILRYIGSIHFVISGIIGTMIRRVLHL